jgi:hypothetical protein
MNRHNYRHIEASDPTFSVNDDILYERWLNSVTGEAFVCTDNTVDANIWIGNKGTEINNYLLLHDSFTDAVDTLITAHTPDVLQIGSSSWSSYSRYNAAGSVTGLHKIADAGTSIRTVTTDGAETIGSKIDIGVLDVIGVFTYSRNNLPNTRGRAITVRTVDSNDCIEITLSASTVYLRERIGGSNSDRATFAMTEHATDDQELIVIISGPRVKAYHNRSTSGESSSFSDLSITDVGFQIGNDSAGNDSVIAKDIKFYRLNDKVLADLGITFAI